MSFRNNAFATVWEVKNGNDGNPSRIRVTTSKKKQEFKNGQWVDVPGQYETDFSGWVFLSRGCSEKAKNLKPKDRVQLVSVDTTVTKSKENPSEYVTFFRCFDLEKQESATQQSKPAAQPKDFVNVPDGIDDTELPFN